MEKVDVSQIPDEITIADYPNYRITKDGNVFNGNRMLKPFINKDGYMCVKLSKNGKAKNFFLHRLIAESFIPNPENKPYIDHINCIRTDNRLGNLRWVTIKENNNNPITKKRVGEAKKGDKCPFYGIRGKCNKQSKALFQFDSCGNLIKYYECIDDCCKENNYNHAFITRCCQHKCDLAYGYRFEYALDYFADLIRKMRHAQRRYFATRSKDVLAESKRLEALVDAVIGRLYDKQMKLF